MVEQKLPKLRPSTQFRHFSAKQAAFRAECFQLLGGTGQNNFRLADALAAQLGGDLVVRMAA